MTMIKVMYLMNCGCSLTQAVDYSVVVDHGIPPEDWANARGVTPRAVTKSVDDAAEILGWDDEGM